MDVAENIIDGYGQVSLLMLTVGNKLPHVSCVTSLEIEEGVWSIMLKLLVWVGAWKGSELLQPLY